MTAAQGRCQCCGRKKRRKAGGLLVKHYYKARRCFGSDAVPFEEGADAIEAAIAHYQRIDDALTEEWRAHRRSRRNAPLPAGYFAELSFAIGETLRLERRLKRQRRQFGVAAYPLSNPLSNIKEMIE